MADKKKLSVEEILAACRKTDGAGGSQEASSANAPSVNSSATDEPAAVDSSEAAESAAKPAATKKSSAMSTADILAAARGTAGGSAPAKSAAADKPKAEKPAASKNPGAMSVADILAAARAGKSGAASEAKEKPAAKPAAPKAAPAAKEATPKAAAKPAASGSTGSKDTASILAAARGASQPGPMSKAEAAAKAKETAAPSKKKSLPPMPQKPSYAQAVAPVDAGRRVVAASAVGGALAFIVNLITSPMALGFGAMAVTFKLWGLGFARFMFPNILIEPPTKFKVGFPTELAPGQVQTKYIPQFGVWIVRHEYDGASQIYALQSVCTHLGCTPSWLEGEQKFKCPCHGSGFYKDGINFEGPAPRPLERFAIRVADDGQLEVDKSRKFKEEMGQWRDSASFVSV